MSHTMKMETCKLISTLIYGNCKPLSLSLSLDKGNVPTLVNNILFTLQATMATL